MLSIEKYSVKRGKIVRNWKELKDATGTIDETLASVNIPCAVYKREENLIDDLFRKPIRPKRPRGTSKLTVEWIRQGLERAFNPKTSYLYRDEVCFEGSQIKIRISEIKSLGLERSLSKVIDEINKLYSLKYKTDMQKYRADLRDREKSISAFKNGNRHPLLQLRRRGFIVLRLKSDSHYCGSSGGIH
ncbi:MAG: hypothetical protein WCT44_01460 [Candidatus Paceibacterota bacterium]